MYPERTTSQNITLLSEAITAITATPAKDIGVGEYFVHDEVTGMEDPARPVCAVGHIIAKAPSVRMMRSRQELEDILASDASRLWLVNDSAEPAEPRKRAVLDHLRKRLAEVTSARRPCGECGEPHHEDAPCVPFPQHED